jgi:molybdenum cofactor synthesis domain-containing protein
VARIAILTASDKGAAGEREDTSGDLIEQRARAEATDRRRELVGDNRATIARILADWCDQGIADVIITTGGTGLTVRDVTPEATRDIAERDVPPSPSPSPSQASRTRPTLPVTRGIAVTRGNTLVVNLPEPQSCRRRPRRVLPLVSHIAELLAGPVEH